jgi:hypothetical protein
MAFAVTIRELKDVLMALWEGNGENNYNEELGCE